MYLEYLYWKNNIWNYENNLSNVSLSETWNCHQYSVYSTIIGFALLIIGSLRTLIKHHERTKVPVIINIWLTLLVFINSHPFLALVNFELCRSVSVNISSVRAGLHLERVIRDAGRCSQLASRQKVSLICHQSPNCLLM